jgi:hypothetical protein
MQSQNCIQAAPTEISDLATPDRLHPNHSEAARESNFFVALVAHHDTRTGDPNCGRRVISNS